MRKTIGIDDVLNFANIQLSRDDQYATQEFKSGICNMLDQVLMATGNYHGFNYTHWNDKGGYEDWVKAGSPKDMEVKYQYIYGPKGKDGAEYDRRYY